MTVKKISLSRVLPYLVLLLALALSVGMFAMYGIHNLDADMSSEMELAQLLNEEGGFMTENWYNSTELRVISPVPVYQLGLLLFDSWHMARTFSIAVLLCGAAASLLYAMRGAGVKDAAVFASAAIVLPFSEAYVFLFTYGAFYTVYFMAACWVLGILLRLDRKKGRVLRLVLLGALGFWYGLSGVRMLMICGAPLLLACGLLAFVRLTQSDSLKAWAASQEAPLLGGSLILFAGMAAGYLVNSRLFAETFHFTEYGDEMIQGFSASMLLEQMDDLFLFFGFREGVPLLSIQGICSLAALFLAFAVVAAPVVLLFCRKLTVQERMVPLFSLCAVGLGVLLNGVTGRIGSPYAAAYFMAGLLLAVFCVFFLAEKLPVRMPALRTLLLAGLVLVFALEARCFLGSRFQ